MNKRKINTRKSRQRDIDKLLLKENLIIELIINTLIEMRDFEREKYPETNNIVMTAEFITTVTRLIYEYKNKLELRAKQVLTNKTVQEFRRFQMYQVLESEENKKILFNVLDS